MRKISTKREIKAGNEFIQVLAGKLSVEECQTLGKKSRKKVQHEAREQENIFRWVELQKCKTPELGLLFAIPNGGSRHRIEAYNLKKQGVRAGIPDMMLPVARDGFNGLFIELKVGKGKASESQNWWINQLQNQNYKAVICHGFDEAIAVIKSYLGVFK